MDEKQPLPGLEPLVDIEELAAYLGVPVSMTETAMRQVGWHSRGHAARLFREYVGMAPAEYRRSCLGVPADG